MNFWDGIITLAIVLGAAFYLYRKFNKSRTGEGCGCAGGGGCGGASDKHPSSGCCGGRHH